MGWPNIFQIPEGAEIILTIHKYDKLSQGQLLAKVNIPLKDRSNFVQRKLNKLVEASFISKDEGFDKRQAIYSINYPGIIKHLISIRERLLITGK